MATPEEWAERIGQTINAQFTLTWDTKQTLGQYLEILDGDHFDIDNFLEYVRDNALETIAEMAPADLLGDHLTLVADDGMEI
jgi:hypothetical protein